MSLFAQAGPDVEPVILIGVFLVVLVVVLAIGIAFLMTLSKALSLCHPRNRVMEPGAVWLNLIPLFNIVWQFITVNRVGQSLENEFRDRGWHKGGNDYGRSLGITSLVLNWAGIVPFIGVVFALAAFVCWIMYWVKISGFNTQLKSRDFEYEDEEFEDDRPRGRGRDDRDDDYDDRDDRDDRRGGGKPWERR